MEPLRLSMYRLALNLRVPVARVTEIAHERRTITPHTALRPGRLFGTTPEFWRTSEPGTISRSYTTKSEAKLSAKSSR